MKATTEQKENLEIAAKPIKDERLEARVTAAQKQMIQHAAYLRGQSLTDFVVNSVQEAAMQTIRENEILELTKQDREVFINALTNPPAPTKQARIDAQWYKKLMGK